MFEKKFFIREEEISRVCETTHHEMKIGLNQGYIKKKDRNNKWKLQ